MSVGSLGDVDIKTMLLLVKNFSILSSIRYGHIDIRPRIGGKVCLRGVDIPSASPVIQLLQSL